MADTLSDRPRLSDILRLATPHIACLSQPRRPLAIGLGPSLAARLVTLTGCDPQAARYAVAFHVNGAGYLRGCREGADRVDLDGNATGVVTAVEAAYARGKLERVVEARQAARRASAASAAKPEATPAMPKVNPATGRRILGLLRVAA